MCLDNPNWCLCQRSAAIAGRKPLRHYDTGRDASQTIIHFMTKRIIATIESRALGERSVGSCNPLYPEHSFSPALYIDRFEYVQRCICDATNSFRSLQRTEGAIRSFGMEHLDAAHLVETFPTYRLCCSVKDNVSRGFSGWRARI